MKAPLRQAKQARPSLSRETIQSAGEALRQAAPPAPSGLRLVHRATAAHASGDVAVAWAAATVAAEALAAAARARREPAKVPRQTVVITLARPKVLLEAP